MHAAADRSERTSAGEWLTATVPSSAPPKSGPFRVAPPRQTLLSLWVVAVVFFGGLLTLAQAAEGPLDDPDPAFQRPGLLDVGDLPEPAPAVRADVELTGHPTVVFFERRARIDELCRVLEDHRFGTEVQIIIVTPSEPPNGCPGSVVLVADPTLADAFGMRQPREGGPPVGYAVIDAEGLIRYRTLDPAVASLLGEIDTILGALP